MVKTPSAPRTARRPSWREHEADECDRVARADVNKAALESGGSRLAEERVCPGAGCCGRWDTCLVPLTVLIVDDHEGFRQVARELLEADGMEVVGEAVDGESAITEAERLRPQLVLLDVQLPGIDGFEVAARLGEASDPPAVVLTSSYSADSYRRRA
jgi:CheY-like chemotaxis protein